MNVSKVLLQELHEPFIKIFERRKLFSRVKDNFWTADLAEMESLSSFNCSVKCL